MDTLSPNVLRSLLAPMTSPCVSVYMPTHPTGLDGQQDPIRLRNLAQRLEGELTQGGMRAVESKQLLEPLRALAADSEFWHDRSQGLAAFVGAGVFHRFRLRRQFEELALVNNRFHIKPLLPLVSGIQRFYVLALSQKDVRLFEASPFQVKQLAVDGLPASMKEALNYTSVDRGSQVHAAARGSGGLGKQGVVFHGQGGEPETHKDDVALFARQIDAAVQPVLSAAPAPLLLAGVAYLLPIYREVSRYADLVDAQLEGNYDHASPHEIHERAISVMEPVLQRDQARAARRYLHMADTGQASNDIAKVLAAANEGRIDTLFVDIQAHAWGVCRPGEPAVLHDAPKPGDEDLLDLAATQTLLHRGTVYSVAKSDLPGGGNVAATFRY